jgi:hypothetical protein
MTRDELGDQIPQHLKNTLDNMSVAEKEDANFYLITLQTLSCAPLNEDNIPELQHLKTPKLIDPIRNLIVQA